jgi:hypothetical protein
VDTVSDRDWIPDIQFNFRTSSKISNAVTKELELKDVCTPAVNAPALRS